MRIVIAGAGDVGFHLAKLLSNESQDIVIIDESAGRLEYLDSHLDVYTIKGDATCPNILEQANISKADLLIAATSTEANNINISIIGKRMGAKQTIARISKVEYLNRAKEIDFSGLGIDFMISPELLAAKEIERLVKRSSFTDSFEFDDGMLHLVGIRLEGTSPIVEKKIQDTTHLNPDLSFLPVAIKRNGKTIIPRGTTTFKENDYVYFISKKEGLEVIISLTGKPNIDIRNIMILGGSRIGVHAANRLSKKHHVKLIEMDKTKCFNITDMLDNVLVIHGDGRNVELLEEESIAGMDSFIAVTGNSATNIMSCLVAKAHGVKKTIALVENIDYIQLSQMVGIDTMINKKLIAASNIFRHIREGEVLSLTNLHGVNAEVLEFRVKANSKSTRKQIKDLRFPKGAIVGGVIRNGEGFIPLGDFLIQENDHAVVFALNEDIPQVEALFK